MKLLILKCTALILLLCNTVQAQKYEAESATLANGAVIQTCGTCSGGSMVAQQEGSLTLNINIATTAYFDIYIVASSKGGNKTNKFEIDGSSSQFLLTDTQYTKLKITGARKLTKGLHTISITKSWGWINIDYIELVPVSAPVYKINQALVTPNPSKEAVSLYQFLKDNYGKKIISGVQEIKQSNWLKSKTGKEPVLVGTDLLFTNRGYTWYNEMTPINQVISQYNRKGISALCWHWRDPSRKTEFFYTDKQSARDFTSFDITKVNDTTSAEYKAMISDIDYTAGLLKKIQDANVPILWRPLHEAAGGWFWWGKNGPACKKLWQIMFDRLVYKHGLNNLIWVWTKEPGDDAFYPGDEYVDIIGRDYYFEGNHTSVVDEFTSVSSKFGNKKLTTISECGSFPDPDNLVKDNALWSWFMVWPGFVATPVNNPLTLWTKALAHDYVLTLDEMPGWR